MAENRINQLHTIWSAKTDAETPLPEHPRPQLVRPDWFNLNGLWDYAVTAAGDTPYAGEGSPFLSQGKIRVPFSPESELSGVGRQLKPDEALWYRRTFVLEEEASLPSRRVLLHFGAADQAASVTVNGVKAGGHVGGYLPFTCDITPHIRRGENELVVRIRDVSDTSYHSRGKQKLARGGMYYTATSGLWQTVWLEIVPEDYIREIFVEAVKDDRVVGGETGSEADVSAKIRVRASRPGLSVELTVFKPGIYRDEEFAGRPEILGTYEVLTGQPQILELPEIRRWSPEGPWLYYYTARMGEDCVTGYFALRTVEVRPDDKGVARVYLNGRPYYQRGVLDQGYWPEGLYTPPCDEALVFDVREMKKTGFNMARKHAKIEADRWYYHCDRIGLLVWQDMVNGGSPYKDWFVTYLATFTSWRNLHFSDRHRGLLSRHDSRGREEFEREMKETVRALRAHPSVICWVLFNEGWGQFDTERLTRRLRKTDPTRLIDSASGWFDQGCGDFKSTHFYFLTYRLRPEKTRAAVLSEVGGYALHLPDHSMFGKVYGYRQDTTVEALAKRYRALIRWMDSLCEKGLCGYVYTQWSDIEEEVNGVYTYDRAVRKIPEEEA